MRPLWIVSVDQGSKWENIREFLGLRPSVNLTHRQLLERSKPLRDSVDEYQAQMRAQVLEQFRAQPGSEGMPAQADDPTAQLQVLSEEQVCDPEVVVSVPSSLPASLPACAHSAGVPSVCRSSSTFGC